MSESNVALAMEDEPYQRPSVLVVGGTGHVGAALSNFLLNRNHPVAAASRSSHLVFESPKISRVLLDITDTTDTTPLPGSSMAVICPWINEPDKADPQWMLHLLRRLAEAGLRSAFYFSTMWVYGTQLTGLLTESTTASPTSSYGAAHLKNEYLLAEYGTKMGLDISVLRMANLVGPDPFYRFRENISFAHELVEMATRDKAIVLKSPPSTPRNLLTRTLLHHDLEPLLDREVVEGRFEIFNFGSGATSTMAKLAQEIAQLVEHYYGKPIRVEHPPESTSAPLFHLDTTKIRSLAGPGVDDLVGELELVLDEVVLGHASSNEMSEK